MNRLIKNISLPAVLPILLILASCGGGGGGNNAISGNNMTINGTTYTENASTGSVRGYVDQTSQYGYKYGGPTVYVGVSQPEIVLSFNIPTTNHGFPGTYNLIGFGNNGGNSAFIYDKSVPTGGNMGVGGSGTGGSITISSSSSPVGKPLVGNFNLNLCDMSVACSAASIKNYTGAFSIDLLGNIGSLAKPAQFSAYALGTFQHGIAPETGKNYYTVPMNATGRTLTLSLTPNVDVNMAVFTDAGFTTPATCNVTSNLSLVGNGVETCAITVAANQGIYFTVSQANATATETYAINVVEN